MAPLRCITAFKDFLFGGSSQLGTHRSCDLRTRRIFNSSSVLLAQRQSARLLSTVHKFQTRYLVVEGSIPSQDITFFFAYPTGHRFFRRRGHPAAASTRPKRRPRPDTRSDGGDTTDVPQRGVHTVFCHFTWVFFFGSRTENRK